MQIDFHHAVSYTVARLAGFVHDEARIIAYASQYVDDCRHRGIVNFRTGYTYYRLASSQEFTDFIHVCDVKDDCRVWVPFHFLPGNAGDEAGAGLDRTPMERLRCTPDSPLASDMWTACYESRGQANALHRLGITCHVYEDTFAHCWFAGVLDKINTVSDLKHKVEGIKALFENIESKLVQAVPLGHGAVLKFPDLPFLEWSYCDSAGTQQTRNNPEDFLRASTQLFRHLLFYRDQPDRGMLKHDQDTLLNGFRNYTEEIGEDRLPHWLKLIREGNFSFGGLSQEQADSLIYSDSGQGSWKQEALGADSDKDDGKMRFPYSPQFKQSNWYLFHEALKSHLDTVLNELLPKYQIALPLK